MTTVAPAEMVKVRDAAKYLGVEIGTVYNLCRRRKIRHMRVGGSIRFTREMLDEYLQRHTFEIVEEA